MSDIVKRLVALANSLGGTEDDDIMAGVAEINRLQVEKEMFRKAADADGFHRVLAVREAEIERLRSRNADLEEQILHALGERKTPRAQP